MNATQLNFLDAPPELPEGFDYRPDLIAAGLERELVEAVRKLDLAEFEYQGYRGKRRVVSFGLRYDFNEARLLPAEEIPAFLLPLREIAAGFAGLEPSDLAHVLVTEYAPGAGIGWHRDRPVFEDVIGISLLSSCRFRLRRKAGAKWQRASLAVEPRSAYLLRGPARTQWEHSIPPAESLRYSITLRSMRADVSPGQRE